MSGLTVPSVEPRGGRLDPWRDHISELASRPNVVCCKVSGLVTEADHQRWTLQDRLPELLDAAVGLLRDPSFVLLTAHAAGVVAGLIANRCAIIRTAVLLDALPVV